MINMENVSKRYASGFVVLKQIDFALSKGELAFISGESGAGKSSFLKVVGASLPITTGRFAVNGQDMRNMSKKHLSAFRCSLGIIPQHQVLVPYRSVFENIAIPLQIQGISLKAMQKRVYAVLDRVGLLHKAQCLPQVLSHGEKQRICIARAIVHYPQLVLADEPTTYLDASSAQDVMVLFEEMRKAGISIIIATHNASLVAQSKYRVVTLNKGEIVC